MRNCLKRAGNSAVPPVPGGAQSCRAGRRVSRRSSRPPRSSSCPAGWSLGFSRLPARTQHSFGSSVSAGSKPIFASKYAFFSIFQNLQENHLLASKFGKILQKIRKNLQKFSEFFSIFKILPKFCKMFAKIFQKFEKFAREKVIFL